MNDVGNGLPLLQLIPRMKLDFLSSEWKMDKYVRHFTLWKQLRLLLISEVLNIKTLREIESVFGISHSTYNDACLRRNADFFWELCQVLLWEVYKLSSRRLKKNLRDLLFIFSPEQRPGRVETDSNSVDKRCRGFLDLG